MERQAGRLDGGLEQTDQPRAQGRGGASVEQVGRVLEPTGHSERLSGGAETLAQAEHQIKLGDVESERLERYGQARPRGLRPGVILPLEHDLEHGMSGQRPRRLEGLDNTLERHILVIVGFEVKRAAPGRRGCGSSGRPRRRCATPAC